MSPTHQMQPYVKVEDGKSYLQKEKERKMKGKDYEWDRKAERKDGWDHLK